MIQARSIQWRYALFLLCRNLNSVIANEATTKMGMLNVISMVAANLFIMPTEEFARMSFSGRAGSALQFLLEATAEGGQAAEDFLGFGKEDSTSTPAPEKVELGAGKKREHRKSRREKSVHLKSGELSLASKTDSDAVVAVKEKKEKKQRSTRTLKDSSKQRSRRNTIALPKPVDLTQSGFPAEPVKRVHSSKHGGHRSRHVKSSRSPSIKEGGDNALEKTPAFPLDHGLDQLKAASHGDNDGQELNEIKFEDGPVRSRKTRSATVSTVKVMPDAMFITPSGNPSKEQSGPSTAPNDVVATYPM
jgi:hypothetical protein